MGDCLKKATAMFPTVHALPESCPLPLSRDIVYFLPHPLELSNILLLYWLMECILTFVPGSFSWDRLWETWDDTEEVWSREPSLLGRHVEITGCLKSCSSSCPSYLSLPSTSARYLSDWAFKWFQLSLHASMAGSEWNGAELSSWNPGQTANSWTK